MSDKRTILISAKTKEEFEKIEALLDNFYNSFINNFQEVKLGLLSDSLQFKNENAGQNGVVLPDGANNISIKWGESESETSSSKMYTTYIHCSVSIDGKEQFISMDTKGYYKIDQIKSSKVLKDKKTK